MTRSLAGTFVIRAALVSVVLMVSLASGATLVQAAPGDIFDFHSMVGNLAGPGSPVVAGINPAGAAWVVSTAEADLAGNGQLSINVQGLVLQSTGTVPPGLMVEATLACQTGTNSWTYSMTSPTAVSSTGNAAISQTLTLPTPCDAPIVLIRSATSGSWFAVTGYDPPSGDIFDFHSMVGNLAGPGSPVVAGINPAGGAWMVAAAEADLLGSGQINISLQGLVLVSTGTVPAGLNIEATLACQTGTSTWSYTTTSPVPLPSSGNAVINQAITLPTPCPAPIVLIRSATSGSWFAVTGFSMSGVPRTVPQFPLGLSVILVLAPLLLLLRKWRQRPRLALPR
ncbi:MAG: hypothetical protein OK455_07360 [Thaumarchaeota archaeon]|nr:hypothetical protein [Nitrososphaerota archaeon]